MIVKKKRFDHMQNVMRRQADSIYVFAKERENLLNELLLAQEAQDGIAAQLEEAQKKLAAAESRNGVMERAVKGLKEMFDAKAREAAELREQNRSLNALLDRISAADNRLLIEAAYTVAD